MQPPAASAVSDSTYHGDFDAFGNSNPAAAASGWAENDAFGGSAEAVSLLTELVYFHFEVIDVVSSTSLSFLYSFRSVNSLQAWLNKV